jgi:hypothetical protein
MCIKIWRDYVELKIMYIKNSTYRKNVDNYYYSTFTFDSCNGPVT